MFGDKALELVKELKRSMDGTLPPYNEDLVRQVLEEMKILFEQNQKEVALTVEGETGLFSGVHLRHASLERNKRCLLSYIYNRMLKIKNLRWEFGTVLPEEIKDNLCEQEGQWFSKYNKSLATYMRTVGLDLTQDMKPPKSLYIEVRCLEDYGEFETEEGTVVLLKKNSQTVRVPQLANLAGSILGLLRRVLSDCSMDVKSKAYATLVRPQLEYACSVWNPYTKRNIHQIELVQQRAASAILNYVIHALIHHTRKRRSRTSCFFLPHFLPRSHCEHLIRQGILEHIL